MGTFLGKLDQFFVLAHCIVAQSCLLAQGKLERHRDRPALSLSAAARLTGLCTEQLGDHAEHQVRTFDSRFCKAMKEEKKKKPEMQINKPVVSSFPHF